MSGYVTEGPFTGLRQKHYRLALIDLPWEYVTFSDKGKDRSPEQHYDCMTVDELKALPVKELMHKDAIVVFWVIDTHIEIALDIIKTWGFTFKTVGFYFRKTNRDGSDFMGMGHWTRANCEQAWFVQDPECPRRWKIGGFDEIPTFELEQGDHSQAFLATTGKPKRNSKGVRRLISGPRQEHSRKPAEIHDRCEALTDGPYLELFGRQRLGGWTIWGNECDKFGSWPTAVQDVTGYVADDIL